jgi:hypothetical protein
MKARHRVGKRVLRKRRGGAKLGPRPSDPSKISFDDRCFVRDGTTVRWSVGRSALHSGPETFDNEADAEAFGRKVGRPVNRIESPRMRRVSWT